MSEEPTFKEKETIICGNCGTTFVNNPEKHQNRPKYCPGCKMEYCEPLAILGLRGLKKVARSIQKAFKFFQKSETKEIYYRCPSCGFTSYSDQGMIVRVVPDKIKKQTDGTILTLTTRSIPTCPECGKYLVRFKRPKK